MFAEYVTREMGHHHARRHTTPEEVHRRLALGKALFAYAEQHGLEQMYTQAEAEGLRYNYVLTTLAMTRRFGTTPELIEQLPFSAIRLLASSTVLEEQVDAVLARVRAGTLAPTAREIARALYPNRQQYWLWNGKGEETNSEEGEVPPETDGQPAPRSASHDIGVPVQMPYELLIYELDQTLTALREDRLRLSARIERLEWLLSKATTSQEGVLV